MNLVCPSCLKRCEYVAPHQNQDHPGLVCPGTPVLWTEELERQVRAERAAAAADQRPLHEKLTTGPAIQGSER